MVNALLDGEEVTTCPYCWVDQDFALVRGWIQGFPKKLGSVWQTRTFGLDTRADPGIKPGARYGGTCSTHGRRVLEMTVTLERESPAGPVHNAPPIVNVRHFPRLAAGRHDEPAVHELVRAKSRDRVMARGVGGAGDAVVLRRADRGGARPRPGRDRQGLPLHVRLHGRRPRDGEGAMTTATAERRIDVEGVSVSTEHFIGGERVASARALRGHLAHRRAGDRRDRPRRRGGGRPRGPGRARRVPGVGRARAGRARADPPPPGRADRRALRAARRRRVPRHGDAAAVAARPRHQARRAQLSAPTPTSRWPTRSATGGPTARGTASSGCPPGPR